MRKMNLEMANIVGSAKDLIFFAPLIEPKENPPRLYVYPRNNGLMVQMSISGIQHMIGSGLQDVEIACRLADMATLRFRKYRRRIDWNYSEAQAIADTKNDEESGGMLANFLLARIERELSNEKLLTEVEPAKPKEKTKTNRPRTTVEQRLAALEQITTRHESVIVSLQNEINEAQFNRVTVIMPEPQIDGATPAPAPLTVWCPTTNEPTNQQ